MLEGAEVSSMVANMHRICIEYASNMHRICIEYGVQYCNVCSHKYGENMLRIWTRIWCKYGMNMVWDMFSADMARIWSEYAQNMDTNMVQVWQIWLRYAAQNMLRIWSGYASDMFE